MVWPCQRSSAASQGACFPTAAAAGWAKSSCRRSCQPAAEEEGFGESASGTHDAESCCFVVDRAAAEDAAPAARWACGAGEASVLLPCRQLCLCKACEPRADACPVWLGDKNVAIHIAPN